MRFEEVAKKTPLAKDHYRQVKLALCREICNFPQLKSSKGLSQEQAKKILEIMNEDPASVNNIISLFMDIYAQGKIK